MFNSSPMSHRLPILTFQLLPNPGGISGTKRGLLWTELVSLTNSHCMGHLGISGEESSAQCFNLSFMGLLDQSAKSVIKFIWFPSACLNLPVPQSRTSMYFYCPMCMK